MCRVWDLGFGVWGFGFRVLGLLGGSWVLIHRLMSTLNKVAYTLLLTTHEPPSRVCKLLVL